MMHEDRLDPTTRRRRTRPSRRVRARGRRRTTHTALAGQLAGQHKRSRQAGRGGGACMHAEARPKYACMQKCQNACMHTGRTPPAACMHASSGAPPNRLWALMLQVQRVAFRAWRVEWQRACKATPKTCGDEHLAEALASSKSPFHGITTNQPCRGLWRRKHVAGHGGNQPSDGRRCGKVGEGGGSKEVEHGVQGRRASGPPP